MDLKPIYAVENLHEVNRMTIDITKDIAPLCTLEEGTIIVRFYNHELHALGGALFNVVNSQYPSSFFTVYIYLSCMLGLVKRKISKDQTDFHTLVLNVDEQAQVNMLNTMAVRIEKGVGYRIYLNGKCLRDYPDPTACFLKDISEQGEIDAALIGRVLESQKIKMCNSLYHGDIDFLHIYDVPLPEEEILSITGQTVPDFSVRVPEGGYLSDPYLLCWPGYHDCTYFRIPTILRTRENTLLAAFDQMFFGPQDHPNRIRMMMRRSTDGGESFSDAQTIIQMPGNSQCIDSCMLQDQETGRIFLLTDIIPENTTTYNASRGTGYRKIDGKSLRILQNDAQEEYLVWPDGHVTRDGASTPYTVDENFALYEAGEFKGYIFMEKCPLRVCPTTYLTLFVSDDDGRTWQKKADLSASLKEEWMCFFGCCPGNGIQLKYGVHKGRLLMPVYCFNRYGIQSPMFIYSDDHGETWHRGETINDQRLYDGVVHSARTAVNDDLDSSESVGVELPNGDVKFYCKNYKNPTRCVAVATSHDGGETFDPVVEHDLNLHSTYNMSVIEYDGLVDGKHAYLFANSDTWAGNYNGTIKIGLYEEDQTGGHIHWKYSRIVKPGTFGYCFLTNVSKDVIGICYESSGALDMTFQKMNLNFLKGEDIPKNPLSLPVLKKEACDGGTSFQLTFDELVMLTGNRTLHVRANGKWETAVYTGREADSRQYHFFLPNVCADQIETVELPPDLFIVTVNGMRYRYSEGKMEWLYYHEPYRSLRGSGAV